MTAAHRRNTQAVLDAADDDMRDAFREYARTCAQLRRVAEQYYDHTGDYTLITTTNIITSIGMRLERIASDAQQARALKGEG